MMKIMDVKLDGGASVNLNPISLYERINPQLLHEDEKPGLDTFDKDGTYLVPYMGGSIEEIGVKPGTCKGGVRKVL